ncbi:hypothetical protein [Alphabaculovirus altersperidaniae]|uniref:Uncharacterized protein n=1 Tax=Spodoptera eridania nucleopolyhedrovirus TaxID=2315721 RepID=A0ABX6TQ64_9ABAC|nr:hypothetical protein QKS47_gp091 [Spodoptera eridania nucleopolyhedrovirus]QNV47886.1 hypothetical protein [Spodoptera eridania nucleopolyhedrovirus]
MNTILLSGNISLSNGKKYCAVTILIAQLQCLVRRFVEKHILVKETKVLYSIDEIFALCKSIVLRSFNENDIIVRETTLLFFGVVCKLSLCKTNGVVEETNGAVEEITCLKTFTQF